VCLVFVLARYRLPVIAPALVAGTCGLQALVDALRRRRSRDVTLQLAAIVLGVALSIPVPAHKHFDAEYFKLATGYHELGAAAAAEQAYLQALRENPKHLHARHNLAILYEATGVTDLARMHWHALAADALAQGDIALATKAQAHGRAH